LKAMGYERSVGYDPYNKNHSEPTSAGLQFDLIYSFGVIEHVPCPGEFLCEHRRLIKDCGTVVIATPNASGLDPATPDVMLMHQPYHRHILSLEALEVLAKREGFNLVRTEHRNWMDTRHPGMNSRFLADYIDACGGMMDSLFEPYDVKLFCLSPRLWLSFWCGYYYPPTGYMICELKAN
ncbi:MAG: class I SAM-dependent methyltransferase, partial [Planctomycetales bacterium]